MDEMEKLTKIDLLLYIIYYIFIIPNFVKQLIIMCVPTKRIITFYINANSAAAAQCVGAAHASNDDDIAAGTTGKRDATTIAMMIKSITIKTTKLESMRTFLFGDKTIKTINAVETIKAAELSLVLATAKLAAARAADNAYNEFDAKDKYISEFTRILNAYQQPLLDAERAERAEREAAVLEENAKRAAELAERKAKLTAKLTAESAERVAKLTAIRAPKLAKLAAIRATKLAKSDARAERDDNPTVKREAEQRLYEDFQVIWAMFIKK